MILDVSLDPLDENRAGSLKVLKSPAWRNAWIAISLFLWACSLPILATTSRNAIYFLIIAALMLISIHFVVYYLMRTKVSSFHSVGLHELASGKNRTYTLQLSKTELRRTSESGTCSWVAKDIVGAELHLGYGLIVLRNDLVYIPFTGASSNESSKFLQKIQEFTRNK